jgi:hypothetical protein
MPAGPYPAWAVRRHGTARAVSAVVLDRVVSAVVLDRVVSAVVLDRVVSAVVLDRVVRRRRGRPAVPAPLSHLAAGPFDLALDALRGVRDRGDVLG